MAVSVPVLFITEIDLNIAKLLTVADKVMPDQAVEVNRGMGAGVELQMLHFGYSHQIIG